jgi:predicted TIM-barrel fold metal-dependent hydrolase
MIIDAHIHILDEGFWPNEWYDWVAESWATKQQGRRPDMVRSKIEPGMIDPTGERMVADMDAAGVDKAVILPMDWGPRFVDRVPVRRVNEHALELAAKFPDRLIPFAGVDPRRPGAVELMREMFAAGARGLKLYPPAGFDPFDEVVHPLYELCLEYRAPVLFHTGETLAKLSVRYANPLYLQDVHAAYPDLITWIGHAGAKLWWAEALSAAAHSINSYLEFSVWIWDDTTVEEQHELIRMLDQARSRVGIERLIFGTDHLSGARVRGPRFLSTVTDWYRQIPTQAAEIGIEFTDDEIAQILGANVARLLDLSGRPAAEAR